MAARHIGLLVGAAALLASIFLPTPAGMQREAFIVAGLVVLMAAWWMTEALPLTATALMPFIVLPFAGVMSAKETASAYYSDILFLLLGGGFIALAIERTGLHRRLALGILSLLGGRGGQADRGRRCGLRALSRLGGLVLASWGVAYDCVTRS